MGSTAPRRLRQFARFYGVHPEFLDGEGKVQHASKEGLVATLRAYGAPLSDDLSNLDDLWTARRTALWETVVPATTVAWEGEPDFLQLRLPAGRTAPLEYTLTLEDGTERTGSIEPAALPLRRTRTIDGRTFESRTWSLPPLHHGYHRIRWTNLEGTPETLVISAPQKCYAAWKQPGERVWGVFLPLYSLHRRGSWGAGDVSDLAAMNEWVRGQGGRIVANLPLLASFCQQTDDPSPYSPATRLFWNELFLDLRACPEYAESPEAQSLFKEVEEAGLPQAWNAQQHIDYAAILPRRRVVLDALAKRFFESSAPESAEYKAFLKNRPDVIDYACFRAAGEMHSLNWRAWPEAMRNGVVLPGGYDEASFKTHLYAQWRMESQLSALASRAGASEMIWYLDLPLGVSSDSFDVWRHQKLFALSASGGAPPDSFFTKGQDWGFPPLHPAESVRTQHGYFIQVVRRHLQRAKLLRIDHVMGLHRLFWVPHGLPATEGVYVRYPSEDWFAIVALESHRSRSGVCGENLGTVPEKVDQMMKAHGLQGTYCLQFSAGDPLDPNLRYPDPEEVACLNTHDMPPFASFWQGFDVDDRLALGLLGEVERAAHLAHRGLLRSKLALVFEHAGCLDTVEPTLHQALRGALRFLARSEAGTLLVNLEDLWLEPAPQNTPGTWKERPNWRRRAQLGLEQVREAPEVLAALAEVLRCRSEHLPKR